MGVIIVSYASSDVIGDCLSSLAASENADLRIVICDNASPDKSRDIVRNFARDHQIPLSEIEPHEFLTRNQTSPSHLTLISSSENLGYAGGVNLGLDYLMKSADVDHFWILNPDSVVQPDTASSYARSAAKAGRFGLMSGRTLYYGEGGMIQSDGGWVSLWTGVCRNINQGEMDSNVSMPDVRRVNFLSGANIVASREYVVKTGKMRDDYFLYYEEVDWAMRRGDLPIVLSKDAIIHHHGGTAIGSGTVHRMPSAFSNYFNYRNRMIFMRRFRPWAIPVSYAYSTLKIGQLVLKGAFAEAFGAWRGLNFLRPPKSVSDRIDVNDHKYAFGAWRR